MFEIQNLILLFIFGIVAGFINVMAGGGSTLTLPILILMGMDAPLANGTNRIGILMQTATATMSFKQEKKIDFKSAIKLSIFTIPGAILGTYYAIDINNRTFEIILAIVMIGTIITILIPNSKKKFINNRIKSIPKLLYLIFFLVGFYGGFIQVGIGFILILLLQRILNLKLLYSNIYKVFIVLIYTVPVLFYFIIEDKVDFKVGLILGIGNSIGAWISSKVALKSNEKVIKLVLIISIILIVSKLLKLI